MFILIVYAKLKFKCTDIAIQKNFKFPRIKFHFLWSCGLFWTSKIICFITCLNMLKLPHWWDFSEKLFWAICFKTCSVTFLFWLFCHWLFKFNRLFTSLSVQRLDRSYEKKANAYLQMVLSIWFSHCTTVHTKQGFWCGMLTILIDW